MADVSSSLAPVTPHLITFRVLGIGNFSEHKAICICNRSWHNVDKKLAGVHNIILSNSLLPLILCSCRVAGERSTSEEVATTDGWY